MRECAHKEYKTDALRAALALRASGILLFAIFGIFMVCITGSIFVPYEFREQNFKFIKMLLSIVIPAVPILLACNAFSNRRRAVRLTITEHGIGMETVFCGRHEISWNDIREIENKTFQDYIVIKTACEHYLIGAELERFTQACEQLSILAQKEVALPAAERRLKSEAPDIVVVRERQQLRIDSVDGS